jgi:AcrR family transcriptional regulator
MHEPNEKKVLGRPPKQGNQRQRILNAAAKLIATIGYEQCSLGDIAKELDLTRPALYHYFSTKQEIFTEITMTIVKEMYAAVSSSVDETQPYAEQLEAVMVAHAEYFESNYWIMIAGTEGYGGISKRNLDRIDEIEKFRGDYEKLLARIIRRGIKSQEFRKVDVKATIVSIYQLLNVVRWYRPGGKKTASDIARENFRLLFGGLKYGN